jgi:Protein of unknown function, DUF481
MFRMICLFCFTTCFISMKAFCQSKDTIILYHGEVIIGEVQGADLGSISIDDIDLKMISIKFFRIKTLIINEKFKIETIDKKIYYGTLKTNDKPGWVEIHPDTGNNIPIRITHIYQLISVDTDFFNRLNGSVSAGFSFTKSSDIGQFNLSANVQFASQVFNYQVSLSSIASIDSSKLSRDNENAILLVSYDLTPVWFLSTAAQYQRNLELSISRRLLGLLGVGNKLVIKKNLRLLATTGISFSQEKSTEGVQSGLQLDIPVAFQFNFYQFHHPDIQISSTQTVYFGISQQGRIRYDGTTNFSWQLIRYFYLTISPYNNFDSNPPAGNGSHFDYGIVMGLSYKF